MTAATIPVSQNTALDRQKVQTTCLEALVKDLQAELFQMSAHYLRMGWNAGFEDYYAQRREVNTKLIYAERDLARSLAQEAELVQVMVPGATA